jgi:hypothetical protein
VREPVPVAVSRKLEALPLRLKPGEEMLIHVHSLEPCGARRSHEVGAHLDEVALPRTMGLLLG